MIPNANGRYFRIKAAQRDLIAAAGGIERVAEIVGFSKSQVGRWHHGDSPDLMLFDLWLPGMDGWQRCLEVSRGCMRLFHETRLTERLLW
jgi:hypothetical protein